MDPITFLIFLFLESKQECLVYKTGADGDKKEKKEKNKKRNRTQPVQESSNINLSTWLVIAIHTFIRISLLTVFFSYI